MIATDEDALICDMYETYRLSEWRVRPSFFAKLAAGLRDNSRIKMRMNKTLIPPQIALQAAILDALHILIWQNTKNGMNGKNPPQSVLQEMGREKVKDSNTVQSFDSGEEFLKKREEILIRRERQQWHREQN